MKISIDNGKVRKVQENDRFRFRAWHKPTKRLFEVLCFTTEYVYEYDEINGTGSPTNPAKIEKCVLEQCTGLKDKHGRLIYEGDIIADEDLADVYEGRVGVAEVRWNNESAEYGVYLVGGDYLTFDNVGSSVEIIGNIHEDKKLLEVE